MINFKPEAIVKLQNLLSSKKIEQLKKKFISRHNIEEFRGCDAEKGIVCLQGDNELYEVKFEDELKSILWKATNNLKVEIEQANISLDEEKKTKYFNSLLKSFEHTEKENKEIFEKFKICYKPQETIKSYLKKYNFTITYKSDIELVHSIFDYMKGKNQNREYILNETDFNLLIEYNIYLVEKEEVPTIEKKIFPNLKQGEISFSYWVLHKELYKDSKIKDIYITFLKKVFEKFDNSKETSIKSQFGNKRRCYKHSFLPEIITKYLE